MMSFFAAIGIIFCTMVAVGLAVIVVWVLK